MSRPRFFWEELSGPLKSRHIPSPSATKNATYTTLFSAYAEVFLSVHMCVFCTYAFLCLRRGVSALLTSFSLKLFFSLPTQRCFDDVVFHVCLLLTFLCLRRGVSQTGEFLAAGIDFSLPTQRCFVELTTQEEYARLFSAYAEVFPEQKGTGNRVEAFLCLRRGVSLKASHQKNPGYFSLPTQRCF